MASRRIVFVAPKKIEEGSDFDVICKFYGLTGAPEIPATVKWQVYDKGTGNSMNTDAANNDFALQAGSPAIDAGVDVGLAYQGAAPDCGAYEKA